MDVVLWGVLPYLVVVTFVGGLVWRYRYDQFGWTTRSSQLYESRLLRIGSPLFHFGLLFVIVGHVVGLLIPEEWTDAVGVTEEMYHAGALGIGTIAGVATLSGIVILIVRRRRTGPVFMATTKNDKLMYAVLTSAIVAGLATTVVAFSQGSDAHNYRESVSVWFRSLFILRPDVEAMASAPVQFHLHVLIGLALFALFPFSRLVHAFTAPLHYLFRPYVVYRSRDRRPTPGASAPRRGWDPVGTRDRDPSTRR
ncbi:respiratory nitrate reductase subunit gamma [Cellulomonas composti]|uniref:Nitrate reductase-like protein NarX n=1 Tax=Cellulomonas composti TaxID=266130 RepID=A0A511JDU1_9CELL|nr:respiratory nitrate reductase subunit gamma [Cellulomonas composti]GEL96154.1 nitrate reductase subunit gamma [Cellulomonas composti]